MSEAIKKTDENVAIEFRHVTKIYKLFANDKQRFKAIFFKGVPCQHCTYVCPARFRTPSGRI